MGIQHQVATREHNHFLPYIARIGLSNPLSELNVNAMICRNCGAGLEADRIDASLGVVSCSHCGSLHDIPNNNPNDTSSNEPTAPAAKPKRLKVALPDRFKIQRGANSLEIIWAVGGLFHGFVLSIMAAGVAYMALTSGMLFLLIGSVGLLYLAAVRTLNTHRIRVDKASLQVMQGPLPWPGSRKLNSSDIQQLYATEHEVRTEAGDGNDRKVRVRKHYRLSANTHKNGRITVLSGLNDPLQALWLEQEIEGLLGIVDKPVDGEHRH